MDNIGRGDYYSPEKLHIRETYNGRLIIAPTIKHHINTLTKPKSVCIIKVNAFGGNDYD